MTDPAPDPPPLPPRIAPVPVQPIGYARPYAYPDPVPTPGGLAPASLFFIGLGAGFVVSLVVWGIGYTLTNKDTSGDAWMFAAFTVLAVKLAVSIVFLCKPGWRLLGGGVMTSIALGFLVCGYSFLSVVCGNSSIK